MLAAWLVATSPIVLYMLVQPMSDIPVAAAWAVAFWCRARVKAWRPRRGAGLAVPRRFSSGRTWCRWPFCRSLWLVASGVAGRTDAWGRPPSARGVRAPRPPSGVLVTAALNTLWYGSPFRFGYESLGRPVRLGECPGQIVEALRCLVRGHADAVRAAGSFVALLLSGSRLWPRWVPRGPVVILAMFVVAVWAEYSAYIVPSTRGRYLRFLLPCWPFRDARMSPSCSLRPADASSGPAVDAGRDRRRARDRPARAVRSRAAIRRSSCSEARTRTPRSRGSFGRRTEPNSIVFSTQHAGSLRYYGGRMTLCVRQDGARVARPCRAMVHRAVACTPMPCSRTGRSTEFKARFGERNVLGKLLMSPTSDVPRIVDGLPRTISWRPAGSADPGRVASSSCRPGPCCACRRSSLARADSSSQL